MTIRDEITDDEIHELINLRKFISENIWRNLRFKEINGFKRWTIEVNTELVHENKFQIFMRSSIDDHDDFSIGLRCDFKDGSTINLMRCNGNHGIHRNKIENITLTGRHIHIATERYIRKGLDAEGFAIEAENEYNNFESAFNCLTRKCNIILVGLDLFNIVN